jgi:hypothetical protein
LSAGFLYDSSIPEPFPTATSPAEDDRLWPYTMDYGLPQRCDLGTGEAGGGLPRGTCRRLFAVLTCLPRTALPFVPPPAPADSPWRCSAELFHLPPPLTHAYTLPACRALLRQRDAQGAVGVPHVGCAGRQRRGADQHGPPGGHLRGLQARVRPLLWRQPLPRRRLHPCGLAHGLRPQW